jgi:hypothetical protein
VRIKENEDKIKKKKKKKLTEKLSCSDSLSKQCLKLNHMKVTRTCSN